jgi:hypothetical protein
VIDPDAAATEALPQRHHRAGFQSPKARAGIKIVDETVPSGTRFRKLNAFGNFGSTAFLQRSPRLLLLETTVALAAAER